MKGRDALVNMMNGMKDVAASGVRSLYLLLAWMVSTTQAHVHTRPMNERH